MRFNETTKLAKSLPKVVDPLELPPSVGRFDETEEVLIGAGSCLSCFDLFGEEEDMLCDDDPCPDVLATDGFPSSIVTLETQIK